MGIWITKTHKKCEVSVFLLPDWFQIHRCTSNPPSQCSSSISVVSKSLSHFTTSFLQNVMSAGLVTGAAQRWEVSKNTSVLYLQWVDFIGIYTWLEYSSSDKPFTILSLQFYKSICTEQSLHYSNRLFTLLMHLWGIIANFYPCISTHGRQKDVTTRKQTEREARLGIKFMLVSRICRDPAASCLDSRTSSGCRCDRDAWAAQNVAIWHPRNETQQSTILLLPLGTSRTNPTHSPFKFKGLWFMLIWCEVQLWPVEITYRGKLLFFILWVHFRFFTSLLLLE